MNIIYEYNIYILIYIFLAFIDLLPRLCKINIWIVKKKYIEKEFDARRIFVLIIKLYM